MDDAYLGGEHPGGKPGRGSENKEPIVAAVSLNSEGNPIHVMFSPVSGFSSEAVGLWAKRCLGTGCAVLSDGLACFRSVVEAGCEHTLIVTGGRHPTDLPEFHWINTVLGNLKTSLSGTFHALYVFTGRDVPSRQSTSDRSSERGNRILLVVSEPSAIGQQ